MTDQLRRESWEITSREEWARRRGKDVPASLAANLFAGADPYGHIDKLIAHVSGQPGPAMNTAMRAGIIAEGMFPEAVKMERPEWQLVKAHTYHRLPDLRLGCTPDFWVFDAEGRVRIGLCQAKTYSRRRWEACQGRPILAHTLQTEIEMIVTGEEVGVLAVIVRDDELPLHLFEVPRHAGAEQKILDAVADFWRRVEAGELPVATPGEAIAAMLDDGSHVDLSGDNYLPDLLEERDTLVATRGEAERAIKAIDTSIKTKLGAASTGWLPGWQISWRAQHRKEYTVPAADIRVLRVKRTTQERDDVDDDA